MGGNFFTADFVYTLPKPFIDQKEFEKRMNTENNDFPEILKCYTIHNNKLYDLLKNYKHNPTDEYVRKVQMIGEIPYKKTKSISRQSKRSIKGGKTKKYKKYKKYNK